MKVGAKIFLGVIVVGSVGLAVMFYLRQTQPKRQSVVALRDLQSCLQAGNPTSLVNRVVLNQSLAQRTVFEQGEFLQKTLQDEVSAEGIAVLAKDGEFGSLKQIFPVEAQKWSQQAGVLTDNCLAFKAEKNGLRAEVVIFTNANTYLVVRCNNVRQLALP